MRDSADEQILHFPRSLIAFEVLFTDCIQVVREYFQILFLFENKNIVVLIFLQVVL